MSEQDNKAKAIDILGIIKGYECSLSMGSCINFLRESEYEDVANDIDKLYQSQLQEKDKEIELLNHSLEFNVKENVKLMQRNVELKWECEEIQGALNKTVHLWDEESKKTDHLEEKADVLAKAVQDYHDADGSASIKHLLGALSNYKQVKK